jgi:hypothetical protein
VIHASHLANMLREGLGLTRAQMAMNLLEQLIDIEGMEPVGEILMVPDPDTFTLLPWTPDSAESCICLPGLPDIPSGTLCTKLSSWSNRVALKIILCSANAPSGVRSYQGLFVVAPAREGVIQ